MSLAQRLQTDATARPKPRPRGRWLPYLLSLPALLVCSAILVPFVTAAVYSLQRYRLNLPYLRGFIGVDNYIDFLSDPAFWNTLKISLVYTAVTVIAEQNGRRAHEHTSVWEKVVLNERPDRRGRRRGSIPCRAAILSRGNSTGPPADRLPLPRRALAGPIFHLLAVARTRVSPHRQ